MTRIIRAEAERIEEGRAEATRYPSNPSSPPRPDRLRWLVYALVGGAAVVVLVVLVVLAITGGFGGGSGSPVAQAGATQAASTGVPAVLPTDVVATVGSTSISKLRFDQRAADFEAQYASQIPDKNSQPDKYKLFRQDVLEYVITYELASQKAEQLKITVTDQDVQTWIDSIIKDAFSGDQAGFDASLKQQGMTLDQLKRSYKESTLFQKVYDQVTKDVTTIPDSDIQAQYDAHTRDSYAGKSLAEVREAIKSTLLDARRKEAWQKWIEQARAELGVTYADGWKPAGTTGTLLP